MKAKAGAREAAEQISGARRELDGISLLLTADTYFSMK